ncbi:hypothetical protein PFISCL1PPCAC_19842 [Pristionchus fissidentatus]|uniref:DUF7747 domain-containing protein n=1 Tax=Pristionchus fissidentatus TaxID=1538716 RepID=A0AAV5WDM9_9BILA|nr:hypothetical protein PFISCL1PPCAC_19842 [Pristionchus fissidentatus]
MEVHDEEMPPIGRELLGARGFAHKGLSGTYFLHHDANPDCNLILHTLHSGVPPEISNRTVPQVPANCALQGAHTFFVSLSSVLPEDLSKDSLSPWSSNRDRAKTRKFAVEMKGGQLCIGKEIKGATRSGQVFAKKYCVSHSTLNFLSKSVILLMRDSDCISDHAAITYSISRDNDEIIDFSHFTRRRTVGEATIARGILESGGDVNEVMESVPTLKEVAVRHIARTTQRRTSKSGILADTDWTIIESELESGEFVRGDFRMGEDHHILLASKWMLEVFRYDCPTSRDIIEEESRDVDFSQGVPRNSLRMKNGVILVDTTFDLIKDMVATPILFLTAKFRSRKSHKPVALPLFFLISNRHRSFDFVVFSHMIDALLESESMSDLRVRSFVADGEKALDSISRVSSYYIIMTAQTTFHNLKIQSKLFEFAKRLRCTVHLTANLVGAAEDGEAATKAIFGHDESGKRSCGLIDNLTQEDFEQG